MKDKMVVNTTAALTIECLNHPMIHFVVPKPLPVKP
jgi:hypothetical protein